MSTTIHSDKKVGPRHKWLALGVDGEGQWHNYRTDREEIVVTDDTGVVWRERLGTNTVAEWVGHIDDARGWTDHPEADPTVGWLEAAT